MKIKKNVNEEEYFSQLLNSIPEDVKESVSLSMEIASQINSVLKRRNISQREFAVLLDKNESEISKWLSGNHNFTTNTIGKIQSVLKEKIVTVPIYTRPVVKFIPIQSYSHSQQADKFDVIEQTPTFIKINQIGNLILSQNSTECHEARA
jgi:transcriptional regulator with XRE-family HTH domain